MTNSSNYRNQGDMGRLQSLLVVAEAQSKRARIAVTMLEIEAANDYAFLSLASAILSAKDATGMSWGNLTYNLNNPCSEEMLRKIASRAKKPSYKTFMKIHDSLLTLSHKRGFELPSIQSMRVSN